MATKTLYKIQLGAFKNRPNAEKTAAVVRAQKFPAAVIQINGLWKVQSGAFSIKSNAEKRLKDIHEAAYHLKDPYKSYKSTFLNAIMVTVPGEQEKEDKKPAEKYGADKVYDLMKPYIDSSRAHSEFVRKYNAFIDIYNGKNGTSHSKIGMSNAWCAMFVDLMFYFAGYLDLIGYGKRSLNLMENAKKKGTWKSGTDDIKFGDIVIYQDSKGNPNHTEFALGPHDFISGNYNGGVHKRHRTSLKTVKGRIRPKYPSEPEKEGDLPPYVRVWAIRFWESDHEKYGDATVFIQYESDNKTIKHVILVDTGMNYTDTIKKLKTAGVTKIDAVIISHDHSDHYGYLYNDDKNAILDNFEVGHVYFPDQTGVKKYQPEYANRIARQAAKCAAYKVGYSYVSVGDVIKIGCFECKAIFQADANKLKEKEGHHFINNMSMIYHIVVDGTWIFDMGGDAQIEAQRQMLEAFKDRLEEIVCHVMKIRWHGDRDGITKDYVDAIKCLLAFCNYHGSENGSGRKSTYNVFRDRGAVVATNYKDGEIYMDIRGKKMEVKGSKTGHIKTFKL
jgi:beta-lactamase superfamily II metal-dependent hydrolase